MKIMPDINSFVDKNKERNAQPKTSMHSFELVVTVVLFVLIGRFVDSKLETTPLFTIALGLVGVIGSFLSAYYRYLLTSKKLDENKAWTNEKVRIPAPTNEKIKDELVVPQGYGQDD